MGIMFSFLLLFFFPYTSLTINLLKKGSFVGFGFVLHDGSTFLLISFVKTMQKVQLFET